MTDNAWRPSASRPEATEHLEGYDDLVEIGRGGDSIVYRARQVSLGRMVAIKVLGVDDPQRLARFARELQITVELGRQHPNIVSVLATGTTASGLPAIVMDYHEGGTLHDRLKAHGPLTVDEVINVGVVVSDALAFAHERGVLHRDVKPQNILILPTTWVLADFGIARLAGSEHTASVETFTYRHAAPQILDGYPPTQADDIWSLGSTLFTIADGRPPFASDDPDDDTALAYLRRARTEPHRDLAIPDADRVAAVIGRCLAKRVEDRWQSAAELRDAFKALQHRAWEPDPGPPAAPVPTGMPGARGAASSGPAGSQGAAPGGWPGVSPHGAGSAAPAAAAGPSLVKQAPAPAPVAAPALSAAEQAWAPRVDPAALRSRTVVRRRPDGQVEGQPEGVSDGRPGLPPGPDPMSRPVDPDPVALSVLAHAPAPVTMADESPTGAGQLDLAGTNDKGLPGAASGGRKRSGAFPGLPPQGPAPAAAEPPPPDPDRKRRRVIIILAATAVIVACVLILGGRLLRQDDEPREGPQAQGTEVPTLTDAPPTDDGPQGRPEFEVLVTSSKVIGTNIELEWRDNTDGKARYVVLQSFPKTDNNVLGQVPLGNEEFTVTTIVPDGGRYCFVVRGYLPDGSYGESQPRCINDFQPNPGG